MHKGEVILKKYIPISILSVLFWCCFIHAEEMKAEAVEKSEEIRDQGAKPGKDTSVSQEKIEEPFNKAKGNDSLKVRTGIEKTEGVSKDTAETIKGAGGKRIFMMDMAKVLGYLDNPQAIYILDFTDPNFQAIRLERSFKEFLYTNIDKETFERLYDSKLKPER